MGTNLLAKAIILAGGLMTSLASLAASPQYPDKPVTLVVGYSAGGATDRVARMIAKELDDISGQRFIVDNKPGANSNIAAAYVAGQPANGYTIFVGSVANTINRALYKNLNYDILTSFEPVVLLTTISNILVVNPNLPVKTVQEYINYAKSHPGKMTCASSGNGSSIHLSCELFKMQTGTDILHVPYKGSAPAVRDVIGGQVDSMFDNLPSSIPQVRAGKLRALAVTAEEPVPFAPGVPTVSQSGVKGFAVTSWFGFYAPKGTPKAIIDKLNSMVNKALKSAEIKKGYEEAGFMLPPAQNTPALLGQRTQAEVNKWAKVVGTAGLQVK